MRTAAMLVLSGAVLAFAACAQSKKTSKNDATALRSMTAVRMDRGACFGRCPVYSIELRRDGNARYYGKNFTQHQGIWEKNIGADKAVALLRQFETARVDTCKNMYDVPVSDLPGLYYRFDYADKSTKNINNANFGPRILGTLGQSLDEAVQVDNTWRKIADTVTNENNN